MTQSPESLPRRNWLLHGLQASIAATAAAILYPVVRFLRPRSAPTSGAMEVVVPFGVDALKAAPQPPFDFGGQPCLVIHAPDGRIRAFNAVCTHLECTVEYRPQKADIFCNCHNGVYDLNGRNVSGPPPRPLEEYKVTLREKAGGKAGEEEIVVSRNA
jgi:cytochrome b6-f complex iron-sulfur subunit